MCGICGVIQVGGEPRLPIDQTVLDRMTDRMTHRGPNDRGTYLAPGIALGVRRLSIVDVAGGRQPVFSEEGDVVAIQNGELYNHLDLRRELDVDGHTLVTQCDTEVLPHVYERDGDDLPRALRGKFALAVWDGRRRRALLARDRMGVKPLYVSRSGDLLVFASELKSLLASGIVATDLDHEAIDTYLTLGYFVGPTTPLRAVRKLLPGHRLVVQDGDVRDSAYWQLPFPSGESRVDDTEIEARFLHVLDEAVTLRLMSDVPLGIMLSGGLDSALIAALVARKSPGRVRTFSVGFREDEKNELADARLVASAVGADHYELELSFLDDTVSVTDLSWSLDEPLADLSALGFHSLSALAARHVTVALAGQGADELFAGYPVHRNAALRRWLTRLPGPVQALGAAAVHVAPSRYRRAAKVITTADPVERFLLQCSRINALERSELLKPLSVDTYPERYGLVEARLGRNGGTALAQALYLSQQFALVDDMLQYFDRTSMAHSLEVRVPFLDHEVVEFAASVPDRLKVDGRLGNKVILRRVARDLVPRQIIEKKKIGFFSSAAGRWIETQAHSALADWLMAPDLAVREVVDPAAVRRLVGELQRGEKTNKNLLLAILLLEVWLADTLPRALAVGNGST